MNILRIILFALIIFITVIPTRAQADGNCTGSYGGGYTGTESCAKITIDKKVLKPGTKDYVDGLSLLDPKYHSGDVVVFQVIVTNTGSQKLTNLTVVDAMPQYVAFVSGPGSFDKATNKVSFTISALNSGESQTFYFAAKVVDNIAFNDNGALCTTNAVHVSGDQGVAADDTAQFCIERVVKVYKPVLGIKQAPPTGPVDAALPILVSMAGAGMYLVKKFKV